MAKNTACYALRMNTPLGSPLETLAHLTDDALHASVRALVGRSNQLLAALLLHLAEVEARGIHRERSCATLTAYCVYELRMSEDAAYKRARAAAIARAFPVIIDKLAAGEIHLTGILMLGPHLTRENYADVLARAQYRTKREIAKLVAELDPHPDVPALVQPLRPETRGAGASTWARFVAGLTGPVRELPPGQAPKDWTDEALPDPFDDADPVSEPAAPDAEASSAPSLPQAPQRYKVQFTASQEYVDLLEQARDLLSHVVPARDLEQVQLRAMRALVAELRKRRCAATTTRPAASAKAAAPASEAGDAAARTAQPAQRRSGRTVPAAVRREVWERDQGRCAFVDARGQRCRETARLELHHREPYARGGPATVANISLRCHQHNALAAEQDFGRDFMRAKIEARVVGAG